jgi:hypothetical protein
MGRLTLDWRLKAGDLFDSLGNEDEQEIEKCFEVEKNLALEQIMKGFEDVIKNLPYPKYDETLEYLPDEYSAKDVEIFSSVLDKYQDIRLFFQSHAGHYLSGLINKGSDDEFTIHTKHLEKLPNSIGLCNNEKKIIVRGNVDQYLGSDMSGGIIIMNGDTGDYVGPEMTGGEIHLNGDYHLSDKIRGGNVYHKGRLIVKDGRLVE